MQSARLGKSRPLEIRWLGWRSFLEFRQISQLVA